MQMRRNGDNEKLCAVKHRTLYNEAPYTDERDSIDLIEVLQPSQPIRVMKSQSVHLTIFFFFFFWGGGGGVGEG